MLRIGMTADITQGFLGDAINLNLSAWRKMHSFIERLIADKAILEFALRRGVFDRMGQRKLQSRGQPHVLQRRRTEIFANSSHFLRDRFNLVPELRNVYRRALPAV